jgi:hypothetical protein
MGSTAAPPADRLQIAITERGRRALSEREHLALDGSEELWDLSSKGLFSVRRTGFGSYEIEGSQYVGRATGRTVELAISEKVAGTLPALISAATNGMFRLEHAPSPAAEFDRIARLLVEEFTAAAGRYIASRRAPRYRYRPDMGPVLAGSLDMPATMRLHAAGRIDQFAFRRGEIVRDTPLDQLVLAALDELDRASQTLELPPETVFESRWLGGALAEVRTDDFARLDQADLLAVADSIAADRDALDDDADLARLASVVLLHQGFGGQPSDGETVPRSLFINLERLFEQAVRQTLDRLLPTRAVDKGSHFERRMFVGGIDSSRTNPDLVVHDRVRPIAAGDMKYKSLSDRSPGREPTSERGPVSRPDLYQLLVHAASLSCRKAFLVYASDDAYDNRYLGRSTTGCDTWIAQVRPRDLRADLARLSDELELAA